MKITINPNAPDDKSEADLNRAEVQQAVVEYLMKRGWDVKSGVVIYTNDDDGPLPADYIATVTIQQLHK